MRNRWIKLDGENNILAIAYLNETTPDLLNKVDPGDWVRAGDADVQDSKYDLAQEGGLYDAVNDICRPPKPFESWMASGNSWAAPVDPPNGDATGLKWSEETQSWIEG
jgi:hypothetical protein